MEQADWRGLQMPIRILITGGTFDKEYNELNGFLYFKDTHLPEMLRTARTNLTINYRTLMMMDSLEMTDSDRELITHNCQEVKETQIIITHGTDTMPETAKYLADRIKDKTIVLTGAMIPIVFGSSDGLFNLGAAVAYVQSLPHGVYIAMNGKLFNSGNVRKNREKGIFEEGNTP